MPELDRNHILGLIEKTGDEGSRAILLVMVAMLDQIAEHRRDFREHEDAEMRTIHTLITDPTVHQKQHAYIEAAMAAQAERAALRKAIIEKSLGSLVWSALAFVGVAVYNYLTTHGVPK